MLHGSVQQRSQVKRSTVVAIIVLGITGLLSGCELGWSSPETATFPTLTPIGSPDVVAMSLATATAVPTEPPPTPTPAPTPTPVPDWYQVQHGDTWNGLAQAHDVTIEKLLELNRLEEEIDLSAGHRLAVPSQITVDLPQSYLAHDSELLYGRSYVGWNTERFLKEQGGALATYTETIHGEAHTAAEIIDAIALRYFVGPRPLLALMELTGGVVTGPGETAESAERADGEEDPVPLFFGREDPARPTLRTQVTFVAKKLMEGYYGQLEGRRDWVVLKNGVQSRLYPGSNPGTAGVANVLALLYEPEAFIDILQDEAFQETYEELFGEVEGGKVMPPDGKQPYFTLPFAKREQWYFTGGPHGGYGDGFSGWAALDFAPPVRVGCRRSTYPVRAVARGLVIGSNQGETWVDLDGDGDVRTGWVLLYMHLASDGRVETGTYVETGDIMGYPSCEGGYSTAAHLHLARLYNGQWMPANGPIPFQVGEWTAEAIIGSSYDGYLHNAHDRVLEACDCRNVEQNRFPGEGLRER